MPGAMAEDADAAAEPETPGEETPPVEGTPRTDPAPSASSGEGSGSGRLGLSGRQRRRRWERRLLALCFGVLMPLIVVEFVVRVAWGSLVSESEKSLLDAESLSLGKALRVESLTSPALWMRTLGDDRDTPLFVWDPKRGIRLKRMVTYRRTLKRVPPNGLSFTVRTDRHGLRGADRAPPPASALKVLAVGDSMTYGEGVEDEETWPARLEALLGKELAPRQVRVYNAGVVSFGQQEERDVIRELVKKLSIDLVLLQFTVANDVVDNMRWLDVPGPLKEDTNALETLEHHILLTNPLARWSRAYRFVIWRWGRHAIKYRYMMEGPSLDRSARLIGELRDLSRSQAGQEIPFGVVIAPTVVQVQRSLAESVLGTVKINKGMNERLTKAGIPVLDPLEAMRSKHDAGQQLFIPVDRHWTPAGHQVVAEQTLPFVKTLLKK